MNREKLIRGLRSYARKNNLIFEVDKESGKGSHYLVRLGDNWTVLQKDLNPFRVERVLKQLGLTLRDM
jgi:hypothetical protein